MALSPGAEIDSLRPEIPKMVISVDPSRQDQARDVYPLFTTYGNRITFEADEARFSQGQDVPGRDSVELQSAISTKVRSGFDSLIDERCTRFTYHPLPTASCIRLLRISDMDGSGLVGLSVEVHDLDSPEMPEYDCLSYTWGNPQPRSPFRGSEVDYESRYNANVTWPVLCNGQLLRVRRNLFDALCQIPWKTRVFNDMYDKAAKLAALSAEERATYDAQTDEIMQIMSDGTSDEGHGKNGLMLGAIKGYTLFCRFTTMYGGDPYQIGLEGLNTIDYAMLNGHQELAMLLEEDYKKYSVDRLYWIDAICINQDDLAERSSQVAMMGRVYSDADNVVVWLGVHDELSEGGLQTLQKLAASVVQGSLLTSSIVPFGAFDQTPAFEAANVPTVQPEEWRGLASLYLRQYFRRVWSLQEAVLAKNTVAYISSDEVPWDILLFLAHEFRRMDSRGGKSFSEYHNPYIGAAVEIEAEYIWQCRMRLQLDATTPEKRQEWFDSSNNLFSRGPGKPCQQPLIELMDNTAFLECFDPHDRIYGMLSIASLDPISSNLIPDYTIPLPELWTDFTRSVIGVAASKGDTAALRVLTKMRDTSMTKFRKEGLPTWVPDYGYAGVMSLDGYSFKAAGTAQHVPQTSDKWNELTVQAIRIDVIEAASKLRDMKGSRVTKFDLDPSWFELVSDMDPVYAPTKQYRTEVLWRTLCTDQLAIATMYLGHGESPAPTRYGEQFSDMVCAMILAESDLQSQAEGQPSTMDSFQIEMLKALFEAVSVLDPQVATGEETQAQASASSVPPQPHLDSDRMVDSMLMIQLFRNATIADTITLLRKFEDDSERFTPSDKELLAYKRAPTYREKRSEEGNLLQIFTPDRQQGGFIDRFSALYGFRRLYLTKNKYLGLGPGSLNPGLEDGDEVWIVAGLETLVVLRPSSDNDGTKRYQLIGETYLHGFMRGEGVEQVNGQFTSITLI